VGVAWPVLRWSDSCFSRVSIWGSSSYPVLFVTSGVDWLFIDVGGGVRDVCPIVCGHIRAGLIRFHPLIQCKMTNKSTERIYRIDERQLRLDRTDRMILGAIDDSRRSGDGSMATTSDVIAYGQDMYGEEETPTSMTVRRHMDSLADDGLVHTYQLDEHPSHPSRKPPRAAKLLPWGLNVIDEIGASLPQAETGLTERTRSVEQELRDVRDGLEDAREAAADTDSVSELEESLGGLSEKEDGLHENMIDVRDDVQQLKNKEHKLGQKVSQNSDEVSRVWDRVEEIEDRQDKQENKSDKMYEWMREMHGRVTDVEKRLEAVEAGVEHWRTEWDTWLEELRERTSEKTPRSMFQRLKSD